MDAQIGRSIKGYELRELLGTGSYGEVYRAYQPLIGRDVAVKIILSNYANHPEFIRRFEAEAQLVARLEHPHIVPLYDYWREPDGAYLVMRWVRGGSLQQVLRKGPLGAVAMTKILEQLAEALNTAHRSDVIHRDLKPANILLDDDGNAYLADFGIAKDLSNTKSIYETQPGILGSPAYLSPEQVTNKPVSPQSDIYSLGIMLYELLTGELPFKGLSIVALLFKHVNEPLPALRLKRPDLPEALDAVIQRATAKKPGDRYPDVTSMVRDIRRATVGEDMPFLMQVGETSGSDLRRTRLLATTALELPNPYKGLRAFQEADAADFFGREALTARLLARMTEPHLMGRFMAVVGPSGSGKSSVVRAGLVPAIRQGLVHGSQNWFVVDMFPGMHPLEELANALLRVATAPPPDLLQQLQRDDEGLVRVVNRILPVDPAVELVLVIDQFEEVFTLLADQAARTHFLNSLLQAVLDPDSRLRVIVTLRADFYDRPLLYAGFSELMRQRTEVVTPLMPEELRQAVIGPAERVGMFLEPALVEAIVSDVGAQPGVLPLLQYALTEVFERRIGPTLSLTPYNASGGVLGALARRADELYNALDAVEQEVARQMFLRLVTLGEGTEDTRRRVQRTELLNLLAPAAIADRDPAALMHKVIDSFSAFRLLTSDRDPITRGPTVEVAHEALIRTWGRLREWLTASRDDLRLQRRLAIATSEWTHSGHDSSFLASGSRLDQLASWSGDTQLALTGEERAFLGASLAERDAQLAADAARKVREARLERRSRSVLRALVVVLLVATAGALALSGVAINQGRAAQRSAATAIVAENNALQQANLAQQNAATATVAQGEAQNQAQLASTQAAIAQRNAEESRGLALFAAAESALSQGNNDEALTLAHAANIARHPPVAAQLALADAAYAPGTRQLFTGHGDRVWSVEWSPDGKTALSGSRDHTMILWDVATGAALRHFEGHTDHVRDVAISPDGKTALSGSNDKSIILWDIATAKALKTFTGHTERINTVAFMPNGQQFVSGSLDHLIILWDIASGQEVRRFTGHADEVLGVAISPDGTHMLSGGGDEDKTVRYWDIATGQELLRFVNHSEGVESVAFSPDGTYGFGASRDTTLSQWHLTTGALIHSFVGHSGKVDSVDVSPDGRQLLSGGSDNLVILWDITTGALIRRFAGHGSSIKGLAWSSDGREFLSASEDTTVRLWDVDNGAEVRRVAGGRAIYTPDGKAVLARLPDDTLVLWDAATGQTIKTFADLGTSPSSLAFTPDGKQFAVGGDEGTVDLWDTASGAKVRSFAGHSDSVQGVGFTPDGKTLVTASKDKLLIIWDVATGQALHTLDGHKDKIWSMAISPDGKQVLTGSGDKTMILWDIASGAQEQVFKGHETAVQAIAWSPDGTSILSGSDDKYMLLWDVATAKPVRRLFGHNSGVQAIAWSPDGSSALSGSTDRDVIVWDIATGQAIRRYNGHRDDIDSIAYSHDGTLVLSGSGDGTSRMWRIDGLNDLVAWSEQNRYIPTLTDDQRERFQIDQ